MLTHCCDDNNVKYFYSRADMKAREEADRQRREIEEGKLKAIQDETSRRLAEEEAEKQEKLRKAQARAKAMKNVCTANALLHQMIRC